MPWHKPIQSIVAFIENIHDSLKERLRESEARILENVSRGARENASNLRRETTNAIDETEKRILTRFDESRRAMTEKLAEVSERLQALETRIERVTGELFSRLGHIEWNAWQAKQISEGNQNNQIALTNLTGDKVTLFLPGYGQKSFTFNIDEHGRLCFKRPLPNQLKNGRVLVNTIPKAGTYFIGAILKYLGYQDIEIHGGPWSFADSQNKENDERLRLNGKDQVSLSYATQVDLTLPGQYLVGHLEEDSFLSVAKDESAFIALRDLRHCVTSFFRHMQLCDNNERIIQPSPSDLRDFILSNACDHFFRMGKAMIKFRDHFPAIRFEELASRDRKIAQPSLQTLSKVTGFSEDKIYEALLAAYGTETWTFSGQHTTLANSWTPEVEEAFVRREGDRINEALGYSREFKGGD